MRSTASGYGSVGAAISSIRNHIPNNIRIIVQMTIIASLVIVVDEFATLVREGPEFVAGFKNELTELKRILTPRPPAPSE